MEKPNRPVKTAMSRSSEIAIGNKLGIDATKKLPGEGFKRPWPPLIKMDAAAHAKWRSFSISNSKPRRAMPTNRNAS
jgi:3-polyprenyl-4-hydroxybenzoate decarboxylase